MLDRDAIKAACRAGYKAFRGANGWYAAVEDDGGFHFQPANGGRFESPEAALEDAGLAGLDKGET